MKPVRIGERMVYDIPSRRRTVMVRGLNGMMLKTVRAPRIILVSRTGYSYSGYRAFEAEDDGKPLSKSTRIRRLAPYVGNISAINRVCFGDLPNDVVRRDPVAAFWNTRFDWFRDRDPQDDPSFAYQLDTYV